MDVRVGLYKESWALKNCFFWPAVLEKTLESPLHCKEIQSVHPKGNQSEYSLERLMLKLKLQYFGKEEKGTTEEEMVGWHHRLEGHEFEKALGVGDEQGSLACCSPPGRKETQLSDWTELNRPYFNFTSFPLTVFPCLRSSAGSHVAFSCCFFFVFSSLLYFSVLSFSPLANSFGYSLCPRH